MDPAQNKRKKKGKETAASKKQKTEEKPDTPLSTYLDLIRTLVLSTKNHILSGKKDQFKALLYLTKTLIRVEDEGDTEGLKFAVKTITNIGGVDAVVFLLKTYSEDIDFVSWGLRFLVFLTDRSASRPVVVELGGIDVVLAALTKYHQDSDCIGTNGVGVLNNIGRSVNLRENVATEECMDAVTKTMDFHSDISNVQANGCFYLEEISNIVGKRNALIEKGAFRLLGTAMDTCRDDREVKESGSKAIMTLAVHSPA